MRAYGTNPKCITMGPGAGPLLNPPTNKPVKHVQRDGSARDPLYPTSGHPTLAVPAQGPHSTHLTVLKAGTINMPVSDKKDSREMKHPPRSQMWVVSSKDPSLCLLPLQTEACSGVPCLRLALAAAPYRPTAKPAREHELTVVSAHGLKKLGIISCEASRQAVIWYQPNFIGEVN